MTFEDFCGWYGLESYEDTLLSQREICIEAWNAAVEQTKQACIEAVDILVGADGYVCVHPDEIKNVLMQVEVE